MRSSAYCNHRRSRFNNLYNAIVRALSNPRKPNSARRHLSSSESNEHWQYRPTRFLPCKFSRSEKSGRESFAGERVWPSGRSSSSAVTRPSLGHFQPVPGPRGFRIIRGRPNLDYVHVWVDCAKVCVRRGDVVVGLFNLKLKSEIFRAPDPRNLHTRAALSLLLVISSLSIDLLGSTVKVSSSACCCCCTHQFIAWLCVWVVG